MVTLMRAAFLVLTALATIPAGMAQAAPQSHDPSINPPPAERCFELQDVSRYHSDGDQALILRTTNDRYYRIGFAAQCPNIVRQDGNVAFKARTSSHICDPVDLMVTATASRFPLSCAVADIHPMTAAEVAALPAKNRP